MVKILVIVDAQKDFIIGPLGSEEARKVVPNILDKIESYEGNDVFILTYDTHGDDYMETQEGKYLPIEHCIKNDDGWYLQEDILDCICMRNTSVVFKNTFGSVDLPHYINSETIGEDIESIELVGYVLDICVISNAILLKAFYPEIPIKVDVSCCAATSPENQDAAIRILKSCQIEVINE